MINKLFCLAKGKYSSRWELGCKSADLNVQVILDHGGGPLKVKEEDRRIDAGDGKLRRTHLIWLALNTVERAAGQKTWVAHNLIL